MPDVMEKPKAATDLIDSEIDRLTARQKRQNMELQQQAMTSINDEIETIDTTLKRLHLDREKLGHPK